MKNLKVLLFSICLILTCIGQSWSAGNVTANLKTVSEIERILTINWAGSASDGTVTAYIVDPFITDQLQQYYIYLVCTVPGNPNPTTLYDITLTDQDNIDMMGGALANRSATLTECVVPVIDSANVIRAGRPLNGSMKVNITGNNVIGATGIIKILLFK